jgi:hypothetical protein
MGCPNGDSEHRWWFVLGLAFVFLSMDEVVGMRELMSTLMEENPWTVVGFPVLAVVGLSYLPFLWRYRGRTALLFVLAGLIYGGGVVGVEHFTDAEVNSLHYNMWTALEEGMEMFGVMVLIYAVLDFMQGDAAVAVTVEVPPGVADGLQFTEAGSTRVGVASPAIMLSAPRAIARMVLVICAISSVSTWSLTWW